MSSKKGLIALDIDDVLGDFISAFAFWHNRTYKTSHDPRVWHSYHFEDVLGGSMEDAVDKVRLFFGTPEFARLAPVIGAQERVRELAKEFRLVSVTGRNPMTESVTRAWLAKEVPQVEDVFFTDAFERRKNSKSSVCLKLGAKLIVEDNKKYAVECAEHGIPAVLLNQPWNQGELPSNVVRVRSWAEVPSVIEILQKKSI